MLRLALSQLVVYREHGRRRRVLRAKAVAAAGDNLIGDAGICQCGDNVKVERLALRAGLLGTVKHGDLLGRSRDRSKQLVRAERTVQTNLNQADLAAVCIHIINNFLGNVADRTHRNDDTVRIGSAVVVKQLVIGAELGVDLCHVVFHNARNCIIELVAGLTVLEEYVAILVRAAHHRVLRIQCVLTERLNSVHVAHFLQVRIVPNLNLLNLVGGTEAVKEVNEGHAALNGCKMCNCRKVHNLLRVGFSQHSETGLAAGHNVGVVAEDVQRVGSNRTRGNVEHAGEQLACDLIHIRDHEQQTLRSSISSGQCAGCKRTVHRARRACLGLHFDHLNFSAENVLLTGGGPQVNVVCHGAGRGNRINTRNLGKRIRHVCGRSVTVHGLHLSCHVLYPPISL